jgi:hypothetical protein
MKLFNLVLFFILATQAVSISAQNLMEERIRRVSTKKKSIYLDRGIFHNGGPKNSSSLKSLRHHYSKKLGYERLVFDMGSKNPPRFYGHISMSEKKLYIDFFKTELSKKFASFGESEYVDSVNFFPIQKGTLSVEIIFKKKVGVDLFFLKSPGRFVIDIKKQ